MSEPPLKLAAVSVNRSDFGRMLPIYRRLQDCPEIELQLLATGSHFAPQFGHTIDEMRQSGVAIAREIPVDPAGPVESAAAIMRQTGAALEELGPRYLMLLGDRYEMLGLAAAAMLLGVEVIHVGGGYVTSGALDDSVRHAITKLAHRHLVANQACAARLRQMGEEPECIHVVGAPDIEMTLATPRLSRQELLVPLGLGPEEPFILVSLHPETAPGPDATPDVAAVFAALAARPEQLLLTAPAPDPGANAIMAAIEQLCRERGGTAYKESLGEQRYVNALRHASAVCGNSSSGIIEASAVGTPVVNIGSRQAGREQAANVVNADWRTDAVEAALACAASAEFGDAARQAQSPYGDGQTSARVLDLLQGLGQVARQPKRFHDLPAARRSERATK